MLLESRLGTEADRSDGGLEGWQVGRGSARVVGGQAQQIRY